MSQLNLEWAVAGRAKPGEFESGDLHAEAEVPGGTVLAVMDGLGHGSQAAEVSRAAAEVVRQRASFDVSALLRSCDEQLRGTRGVVMSVAAFDRARAQLTWSGIGNVEGLLVRADPMAKPRRESLLLVGGVVGGGLSSVRSSSLPLLQGDVLVFATDGISAGFADRLVTFGSVQGIADQLLARWQRGNDDALVLVARWSAVA